MTAKPSAAGLNSLIEKSYQLEQRVLGLQQTIAQLRIDMEQALTAQGLI